MRLSRRETDSFGRQLGQLPTVSAIVRELRRWPAFCHWVVNGPGSTDAGQPIEPREIWIEELAVWVRADGFSICGDLGRGYGYPGPVDRLRIRLAVASWRSQREAAKNKER